MRPQFPAGPANRAALYLLGLLAALKALSLVLMAQAVASMLAGLMAGDPGDFATSDDQGESAAGSGAAISLSLSAPRRVETRGVQPSGGTVRVKVGRRSGGSSWNRDDLSDVDLPSHLFPDRPEQQRPAAASVPLPRAPLRGVRITMSAPESNFDGFVFEGSEDDAIEATKARGRSHLRLIPDEADGAEPSTEQAGASAEEAPTVAVQSPPGAERPRPELPPRRKAAVAHISDGLANGTYTPTIGRVFSFAEAADAYTYMASNAQIGKIVVDIGQ